jgi:hypothetical protein
MAITQMTRFKSGKAEGMIKNAGVALGTFSPASLSLRPPIFANGAAQQRSIGATSSNLMERAEIAAKQMRYFGLVAQKSSFSELVPSAKRAGFALLNEDAGRKEASFRWATGEPDFIFSLSFAHADKVSVIAESYGDIFGLVLISHSHIPNISVETKPSLGNHELGRDALRFRDMLLIFPDFDGMPAWTKY